MADQPATSATYIATVRHGAMGDVTKCVTKAVGIRAHDHVVIRTDRGVEAGDVICQCAASQLSEEDRQPSPGEVLRRMTPDDIDKAHEIESRLQPVEFEFCQKRIKERDLPMKLRVVEHLFGGTKIIFYFLADGRVDFRDLVKDLAQEYHCRIEMRQIGVRDEARLLADYEHCGRPLCCRTFVKKLEPVSMKMAKSQKATLDPAKISGRCGRLMCCLRFEDAMYEDYKRILPRKGTRVTTPKGPGVVVDQEILCQLVKVDLGEGKQDVFGVEEIERQPSAKSGGRRRRRQNAKGEGNGQAPRNNDHGEESPDETKRQ